MDIVFIVAVVVLYAATHALAWLSARLGGIE